MSGLTTIGFDADDTLWHNERVFRLTQDRFTDLLSGFADPETISSRLIETERKNLAIFGYGVKGFTLSLVETAIQLTNARVDAQTISQILSWGREMLTHPVDAFPEARETLIALEGRFRLVLITKGDLFDQERKLAESGLGDYFNGVEIVSEKTVETYVSVFDRHGHGADRGMMVGNSLKSDVLPMLDAGGWGVHVPHEFTWALEHAEPPTDHARFSCVEILSDVKGVLNQVCGRN